MSESRSSYTIVKWLNAQPNTKAIKTHGAGFGEKGTPDIICSCKGQMIVFENKHKGEQAKKLQAHRLFQWQQAGAVAVVANGLQDVKNIMGIYL